MEIEQKESKEETLKRFGVYHVDGAEYNVYEDVFFKEIAKLEAEIKALREAAKTLRSWLDPDVAESENKTFLNDVAKLDQLLTKNEG